MFAVVWVAGAASWAAVPTEGTCDMAPYVPRATSKFVDVSDSSEQLGAATGSEREDALASTGCGAAEEALRRLRRQRESSAGLAEEQGPTRVESRSLESNG